MSKWGEDVDRRWGQRLLARTYQVGRMKALPLGDGPRRAAHLSPDLPRAVLRWDGERWTLVKVVANLAEAKKLMYPDTDTHGQPEPW